MTTTSLHKPSHLLTTEENEIFFKLLGNTKIAVATGVAHICFKTTQKWDSGIVCLVKNVIFNSRYLALYCLGRNELVWEIKLIEDVVISNPEPTVICVDGNENFVFCFVSRREAQSFLLECENYLVEQLRKKTNDKKDFETRLRAMRPDSVDFLDKTSGDGKEWETLCKLYQ